MYHVEFIGPSGAGKTTLRQELVLSLPKALGGTHGKYECCHRSSRSSFLFKHYPQKIQNILWNIYIRPQYLEQYEKEYPETLRVREKLLEIVGTETIGPHVDEEMALYQLYSSTTQSDEFVIIDDGLYQFHLHLIEQGTYSSLSEFLPIPDVLICLHAEPETCLRRQETRDRGRAKLFEGLSRDAAIKNLIKTSEATERVAVDLSDQGVLVIQVSAEDTIADVLDQILSEIT